MLTCVHQSIRNLTVLKSTFVGCFRKHRAHRMRLWGICCVQEHWGRGGKRSNGSDSFAPPCTPPTFHLRFLSSSRRVTQTFPPCVQLAQDLPASISASACLPELICFAEAYRRGNASILATSSKNSSCQIQSAKKYRPPDTDYAFSLNLPKQTPFFFPSPNLPTKPASCLSLFLPWEEK